MADSASVSDPPYVDVFAEGKLDDTTKKTLINAKWDTVHKFNFPSRYIAGKFRKIQSHWFINYAWLRYSKSKGGVYCAPCYLFGGKDETSKQKTLSAVAVTDPSNIGKIIKIHESSALHSGSCEAQYNFLAVLDGRKKDISSSLSSAYDQTVERNRKILLAIVDTIILCGKQNIAIRGHEEEKGNFTAILKLQAKYNSVLRDHLEHGNARTKYTSPDIQNELIDICGGIITERIAEACNSAPFFGFIADEATDSATMEQMALVLRYFNRRSGKVQEDFLGFAMCTSTTGEALSEAFLDNLRKAGVNIQAMRGQGYDGAANMSGRNRGVQARIRQVVPKAIYTHCKAHSLNLAIVHASKEPHARNMMGTVQEIAFLFDYSAKRLLVFQEHLNDNNQDRAEMERRTKLRTLCETRWAARADALYTFKASFGTVVQSLETLSFANDAKAAAYKAAITQFSFIVTLVAIEHVLSACVPLSKQLQASNTDLLEAKTEADVVIAQVAAERNDPLVWQALYDKAVEMARSVDVEPAIRRGGRQQNRPNAPADTVPDYWRINMYLPFIDHLISELQERVLGGNERYCIQYLLPQNIRNLNDQHAIEIYQAVGDDMIDNQEAFIRECQRWKTRCEGVQFDPSQSLEKILSQLPEALYPNVARCFHLLLVMPVSTASAERSFSNMRRLKTYLRSTMSTERMSGLGLMNIHREIELSAQTVVDIFAQRKSRRLALLFQEA